MPHNLAIITPPRTLANVLLDLKEARRDWEQADADAQRATEADDLKAMEDHGDRMSEADQRTDALRDEFAAMFVAATGLTWAQIEQAIQEGAL